MTISMPVLKGDDYFFYLGRVFSKNEIMLQAPRDLRTVLESTVERMEKNPVFATIYQENRFQRFLQRMRKAVPDQ